MSKLSDIFIPHAPSSDDGNFQLVIDGSTETDTRLEAWYESEQIETALEVLDSLCCLMLMEDNIRSGSRGHRSVGRLLRRREIFRENKFSPGSFGFGLMVMWNSLNDDAFKTAAIMLWSVKQSTRGRPYRDLSSYIISVTKSIAEAS